MAHYELSKAADKDFENIFNFGIDTFGLNQALEYLLGIKRRLVELAEQPKLYPMVDEIRSGYRRSVYMSHSIYYRIEPECIVIVRILGRQDPSMAL